MHRLQSHYNVIRMSLSLLSLGHTNYQTLWIVGMLRKNAGARATHIKADFCVVRLCYTWVFFCFLHVFPNHQPNGIKPIFSIYLHLECISPTPPFPIFCQPPFFYSTYVPHKLTFSIIVLPQKPRDHQSPTALTGGLGASCWMPLTPVVQKRSLHPSIRRRNSSPWSKIAEIAAHGATYYTTETKVRRMQSMCTELQLLSLFSKHIYLTVQKIFSNVLNGKTKYFSLSKFIAYLITWVL